MQMLRMIFVTSTVITTGLALVTPTEAATVTLFFDDFESDLSEWVGKSGTTSDAHGVIVPDPLQSDQALTFTQLNGAGDIFGPITPVDSPTNQYRLSFDYLGLFQGEGNPDDLGGFIGTTAGWLAGTSNASNGGNILQDNGQWNSYSFLFEADAPVQVRIEDFSGSGGIPGDAYFDNVRLEAVLPETPVPEPLTILGSATALGIGAFLKRESSKKQKKG
jgi:hypothetical protein